MTTSYWNALLRYGLGSIAAMLVLLMMMVTTVDVAGRYLFNSPLTGAFEMTELLLAALIFLGLPLATEHEEHITVDLIDPFMPKPVIKAQVITMNWLSAAVLAVLASQLWHKAQSLVADGHVTNTLEIPLAPIAYLMTASCALSALILLLKGTTQIFTLVGSHNKQSA